VLATTRTSGPGPGRGLLPASLRAGGSWRPQTPKPGRSACRCQPPRGQASVSRTWRHVAEGPLGPLALSALAGRDKAGPVPAPCQPGCRLVPGGNGPEQPHLGPCPHPRPRHRSSFKPRAGPFGCPAVLPLPVMVLSWARGCWAQPPRTEI